ncbi:MAG: LTA synthase family protein [Bacteroidaceae bacterium]|nr:LTA synthase family protein [Bacteroidaceae bacterium]
MKETIYIPFKEFILPICANFALALIAMLVCRIAFMMENWNTFSDLSFSELLLIYKGGTRFDWATICYVNALYIILQTLPLPLLKNDKYQLFTKILFVCLNAICWVINLMDSVYFQFIGRRCTSSVFTEFKNDNVSDILGIEFLRHWYFIMLFLIMLCAFWKLYRYPSFCTGKITAKNYIQAAVLFVVSIIILVGGIRGGFDPEQRPLNNKEAKEYTSRPIHSALVLNTPYSIIRTIGKRAFPQPEYFDAQELKSIYSPVHHATAINASKPNVVIIILESFASEYSAYLNKDAKGKGFMPFLDSLMQQGMTFEHMYSNGHSSIDGQASVHLSIPLMVESFFTSHASLNEVNGMASILKGEGYYTAYFHGADNGSLSLDGFSRSAGYDSYHGRNEYANDADWDHHWGIWDEPFLQYYAKEMNKMAQPFVTTIFTITSHHPFQIPEKYKNVYPEGEIPIHKTIQYTDMSLRKFFETAKKQPWYDNTLFVLTGDHTNQSTYKSYQTDLGTYSVPVIFYHPTDSTFRCRKDKGIAQHIDIMPTVLGYTGCSHDYVAFGNDLLRTKPEDRFHVGFQNDIYQITQGNMLLQFDGEKATALYNTDKDTMLKTNLVNDARYSKDKERLERKLKGIIQSYMKRMNDNTLTQTKE